jgi:UDP-2,3-diacylglucosamine hydrolase
VQQERTSNKAQPEAVALFVSDVHLQATLPHTAAMFLRFLHEYAPQAPRLYLLGDLFEYWAGDDDLVTPFHRQVADAIAALAAQGVQVGWIGGNRDFLLGEQFAAAAGMHLLPDPFVAELAGVRILLTHGDTQCTDDLGYQAFRAQVRDPRWQREFLAHPLAQRKAIIEGMRTGSRAAQREKSYGIMDVNSKAIEALFTESGAQVMVHGHTHRPATHLHRIGAATHVRQVLPDWDCDDAMPRGGWLALRADGSFMRFRYDGAPESEREQDRG